VPFAKSVEEFKAQLAAAAAKGIKLPSGNLLDQATALASELDEATDDSENIHADVRLIKKATSPRNKGAYIYTIECRISRKSGFQNQFTSVLSVSSKDDGKPIGKGGIANIGNSSILAQKGEISANAVMKLETTPQSVTIRFSTTMPGFIDKTERNIILD
jgi:hypothetical protein